MTDPHRATHDFLVENVDKPDTRHDSEVGPPRDARWGGKKPPITPSRERAVAEKQAWQKRRPELGELAAELPELAKLELVNPWEVALVIGAGRDVPVLAMRVLARVAAVVLSGFGACAVPIVELGRAVNASERSTRRVLALLVERAWLELVPTFERHGAASSRRANAYTVPAWVVDRLGGITCAGAHCSAKFGQASGTDSPAGESPRGLSPSISDLNARPPRRTSSLAALAAGVESASRTVDHPSAVPDATPGVTGPGTRQGASTDAPPEAPDADGREFAHVAAWRDLAARGDAFAAELLADHERRQARIRAYVARGAS